MSIRLKSDSNLILTSLLVCIVIGSGFLFFDKAFYGFEYEDAFINDLLGFSPNFWENTWQFRAYPHAEIIDRVPDSLSLYSGHFISYSFFLNLIQSFLTFTRPYQLHYSANILLLLSTSFLGLFILKDEKKRRFLVSLCILTSILPFQYVFHSGLKENLSFFLGVTLVTVSALGEKNTRLKISLIWLLVLMLILTKRENILYILIPIFISWRESKLLIFLGVIITTFMIVSIDPFLTENMEAGDIGRSTFGINIFINQIGGYTKSLISYKGFLLFIPLFLSSRFSLKSRLYLVIWFMFLILYSSHYRSAYILNGGEFKVFDSYRYLVNITPLLIGVYVESRSLIRKRIEHNYAIIASIMALTYSLYQIDLMTKEEQLNYHALNERIFKDNRASIVLDNFSLISRLNHINDKEISVLELNSENLLNVCSADRNFYIINRFNQRNIYAMLVGKGYKVDTLDFNGLFYVEFHNRPMGDSQHKVKDR